MSHGPKIDPTTHETFQVWVVRDLMKQFRHLKVETERTYSSLAEEALTDLVAKHMRLRKQQRAVEKEDA